MTRTMLRTFVAAVAAVLLYSSPAIAVDLTGVYRVRIAASEFYCLLSMTQSGTSLSMSGACDVIGAVSAAGTVDVASGAFTLTGQAQSICTAPGQLTIDAIGDGTTFSGAGTCLSLSAFSVYGSTCSNGIADPGEQCEDQNLEDGDCCSSTCQFEASGSPCAGDGNECTASDGTCDGAGACAYHAPLAAGTPCTADSNSCTNDVCNGAGVCTHPLNAAGTSCDTDFNGCTDDVCNGAGVCTHPPNTGPCDDLNACTTGESCTGGACVGGAPAAPGTLCASDYYACTDDVCDASGTCLHTPTVASGSPCEDEGNVCTDDVCDGAGTCLHPPGPAGISCEADTDVCTVDTCDGAGACVYADTVPCDACSFCDPYAGCVGTVHSPESCVYGPATPSSTLKLRAGVLDDEDRVRWSWGRGQAVDVSDFGDPLTSTNYLFCAYALTPVEVCSLSWFGWICGPVDYYKTVAVAEIPAGDGWTPTSKGFKYKSTNLTVLLKANPALKSRVKVRGTGAMLAIPSSLQGYHTSAIVELRADNGRCWTSMFGSPIFTSDAIRGRLGR